MEDSGAYHILTTYIHMYYIDCTNSVSALLRNSPLVMLLKVVQLQHPEPVREVDLTDVLRSTHSGETHN